MYLNGKPVLKVFDALKRFRAARFLPCVFKKTVWKYIRDCWETIYNGLPNRMGPYDKIYIDSDKMSQKSEPLVHLNSGRPRAIAIQKYPPLFHHWKRYQNLK